METLAEKAGEKLRTLIESRGLTQAEAALIIKVDERTLRRYLHDGIDSIRVLEQISREFNVDLVTTFLK